MKTTVSFSLLDIEGDGYHLLLEVLINGKAGYMLIDSGASRTVFDVNRIEKFIPGVQPSLAEKTSTGLGTSEMESHRTTLELLEIGNLKIENMEIILLDLVHVNQSYQKIGLMAIDGVIGNDILVKHQSVIDYREKKLSFSL